MFVKKIEIFGFKTFAEKTEVALSKGLTAIVGPNGCGKTNITDALTWVLGESNVRNIRAQKATDVIFNGSQNRKALGLAEVSITFDNTCATLPLSFSEVTVTRRAFRSGESEFFINKSRCRLKDIYELFLDTGIGREAYSTVSQGEIDAVLSAKPEDRRELLEEAAGVKKYRYRRQEALRKLEKTEANLHRVNDIMTELEEQLEPVSVQAQQAKRYLELEKQLQEVEVGLLIRDLHRFQAQLTAASETKAEADKTLQESQLELEKLEQARRTHAEAVSRIDQDVDQARQTASSLGINLQQLSGHVALMQEKIRAARSTKERAESEIGTLRARIGDIRQRMEDANSEGIGVLQAESDASGQVAAAVAELNGITDLLQTENKLVQDNKASYLELARELAAKRTSLQNSRERSQQLGESYKRLERQIQQATEQYSEAKAQQESVEQLAAEQEVQISESTSKHAQISDESRQLEKRAGDLARQTSDISRDIASRTSRLTALSEMAQAHEGFFEGVRSTMNAAKAGRISGSFNVLADVIGVPAGLETAIETALGANLQDILTDTVEEAKAAIAYLKRERAGRATFLPLDNLRGDNRRVQGRLSRDRGILGIASELLTYDPVYRPALESLLGRCVLVENIDQAVQVSRDISGWNRIVTLEGDVILPSGAVTGGAVKTKGPGLLVRKSEMESLASEVKELKQKQDKLTDHVQTVQQSISGVSAEIKSLQLEIDEARIALADSKRNLQHGQSELSRLARQQQALEMERQEADKLAEKENAKTTALEQELLAAGEINTDIDRTVLEAEERISALEERRSALRENVLKLNVNLASAAEKSRSIKTVLKDSEESIRHANRELDLRNQELAEAESALSRLSAEESSAVKELSLQQELLAAAKRNLEVRIQQKSEESAQAAQLEQALRSVNSSRAEASTLAHEAELRLARLEVQSGQILERLLSEYEIDSEKALGWPVDDIGVERGVAGEVARIRREMRDMGQVNTGAVQEYERIKERWDFLSDQRQDLEQAESQIKSAISEIDINTRNLFMDTYVAVAANFDLMFKQLFNGGKTELSLTQPNNLLDTGVEINIQPPGKKLQDMSLLSGGERALTATAFVFALLLAKPTPFVVMDEVDAPLDDNNVERFAEVLKQFSQRSQFIVITHNRATMEAADYLYGVTMQEPGVSKLISVRLSGENALRTDNAYSGSN